MMTVSHHEATAIHAVPAQMLEHGVRILVLRQFHAEAAPPAFAFIAQHLLRRPERGSRHGLSFASAFLPEIVDWLSAHLGRPSLRNKGDPPYRNPRWPIMSWHGEDHFWPDGTRTTEWNVDVTFQDEETLSAFRLRWRDRLAGQIEQ